MSLGSKVLRGGACAVVAAGTLFCAGANSAHAATGPSVAPAAAASKPHSGCGGSNTNPVSNTKITACVNTTGQGVYGAIGNSDVEVVFNTAYPKAVSCTITEHFIEPSGKGYPTYAAHTFNCLSQLRGGDVAVVGQQYGYLIEQNSYESGSVTAQITPSPPGTTINESANSIYA